MQYSNPKIPEGINTSKEHPLKEFFKLTIGVFGSLAIVLFILGILADKVAHYLPYSIEENSTLFVSGSHDLNKPIVAYLQSLADKISQTQDLPENMKITVHYSDGNVVNAFASLGGHIIFYRGLLEEMPNENALTMVMAHEIAHVKHRHPIRSIGRGIVISLVVSLISTSLGDDIVSNVVDSTGNITTLKFNRDHESEADITALQSVKAIYGHTVGADELFMVFKKLEGKSLQPEFLSTHPATDSRIERVRQLNENTNSIKTMPLPDDFKVWLKADLDEVEIETSSE